MKDKIIMVIALLITAGLLACGFVFNGFDLLTATQIKTLEVLGIICGASAAYCFIAGEISRNNSQMDKLWSVLPIAYVWVIAGMGGMKPRLIIIFILY